MKNLIAVWIGSVLIFLTLSQIGHSQTISFGDAVADWAQVCGEDVKRHCKGVRPGNNRLASCLAAKASTSCKNATAAFKINMDARFAAQAKAPKICKNDIKRFCSGFRGGQARVLRCLLRKDNFRAASRPCKNTLRAAGWLDTISKRANN
jgi:hypothetical protein